MRLFIFEEVMCQVKQLYVMRLFKPRLVTVIVGGVCRSAKGLSVYKMTTFVNEQVKKLDSALSACFEKNLQGTSAVNLSSLGEKDQFLFQASQALDFSNTNLPSFEKVQEYLEKYREDFEQDIIATKELEWLFIAKCTIAIYGQVFANVLNLTLPISESIDYWNNIHGNTLSEIYYALQGKSKYYYMLIINIVYSCALSHLLIIKKYSQ